MKNAYCYASGQVGFCDGPVPTGTLYIGIVKSMSKFEAHCRRGYDNETLLVPGVPEAANQTAGVDALMAFRDRLFGLRIVEA